MKTIKKPLLLTVFDESQDCSLAVLELDDLNVKGFKLLMKRLRKLARETSHLVSMSYDDISPVYLNKEIEHYTENEDTIQLLSDDNWAVVGEPLEYDEEKDEVRIVMSYMVVEKNLVYWTASEKHSPYELSTTTLDARNFETIEECLKEAR